MSLRMIADVMKLRDIAVYCPLCGRRFDKVPHDEEHIFPKWLQTHHALRTRELKLPNFIGRNYKSIKVGICVKCNNRRFGALENVLSKLFRARDAFEAMRDTDNDDLAIWLGKIFWLLCRKSNASIDPKTRDLRSPERVIPNDMAPGLTYLGVMLRAYAMEKGMFATYLGDPPVPEFCYGPPYSLYRFVIDTRDTRVETFDFKDNVGVLGAAIRSGTIGIVCVFDGGLHARFRSHWLGVLSGRALHAQQFNEVVGRIFYDQWVLDPVANQVQYFWNHSLRSVIAMGGTPRNYDPYRAENHDVLECAGFLGQFVGAGPEDMLSKDRKSVVTSLVGRNGKFRRFPVPRTKVAK